MQRHALFSRLCVSSGLWRGQGIEAVARSMMRLGLSRIELAGGHFHPDRDNARAFNYLAEAGVAVAVLRLTGLERGQKLRAIEEAGRRGVPAVIDRAEELLFPDLIDRTREYVLCAGYNGVYLILDNDTASDCDHATAQLALSRVVRHPALRLGFSPSHAVAGRREPADEVRALGRHLMIAYLADTPEDVVARSRREVFGEAPPVSRRPGAAPGRLDWVAYFQALASIRFQGLLNLGWTASPEPGSARTEWEIAEAIGFCAAAARQAGLHP